VRQGQQDPNVACWDTQTGAKIAENDKVFILGGSIESAGGELLAITDYFIWRGGEGWDKSGRSSTQVFGSSSRDDA
jgi:hypothetical protein